MGTIEDISLSDGEDELWSPGSVSFSLLASQIGNVNSESLICDLGAGGAVSSVAIARRTAANVYAIDYSQIAIDSISRRAREYSVLGNVKPIKMDVVQYIQKAHNEGLVFDLILAEGGICGVVGHAKLLSEVKTIIKPRGVLIVTGFTYKGISAQAGEKNKIIAGVPRAVSEYYEQTRFSQGRREILYEEQLLETIASFGFSIVMNFCASQSHWSAYFQRMHRMAEMDIDVARQHPHLARLTGIDEAFHNLMGRKHLSYSIVIVRALS
jgi:SAM-dependent methyltransferase